MTTLLGSAFHFAIGTLAVGVPIFFVVSPEIFYVLLVSGSVNLVGSIASHNVWPVWWSG